MIMSNKCINNYNNQALIGKGWINHCPRCPMNPCHCMPCISWQMPYILTFYKVDSDTNVKLSGAVFALTAPGGAVLTSTSGDDGLVQFDILPCICYTLSEIEPPFGYALMGSTYRIEMDKCGRLFVDGRLTDTFSLPNVRIPVRGAFTAIKEDALTGFPLAGAGFALRANGQTIAEAVSTEDGAVVFSNLPPADYLLEETYTLPGYEPFGALTVTVDGEGAATIDGLPADGFRMANVPVAGEYPYTINYYLDEISTETLVGTVGGTGALGEPIDADLTLFAPTGYQTPGMRSGATHITEFPEDNVVFVVYTRVQLRWYVSYYAEELLPENLLGRAAMPGVAYATVVTLTPAQLDVYRPPQFQSGIQVGGPVAITVDGQMINVLYLPIVLETIVVNHYVETAYGSGSFVLSSSNSMYAYEGDLIISSTLAMNLGPSYLFSYAYPAQFTVAAGGNTVSLYYSRIAS